MISRRHALVVGPALVLVVALAGCAPAVAPVPGLGGPAAPPYEGLAFDIALVPVELRVAQPKDARGIRACDLLTPAQLAEIGLRPETGERGPTSQGDQCDYQTVEDHRHGVGIASNTGLRNPGLPGVYVNARGASLFEPTTIAGHPGARIRLTPNEGCQISAAASDDQLVGAIGTASATEAPGDCARYQRIVELILSNLPPRR
ncbi:MAG: DUF3558 domain-containing protein [Pseudonocardia sp.]